jgi:RNA polymerase sigma-70 factor, ECF subfamily
LADIEMLLGDAVAGSPAPPDRAAQDHERVREVQEALQQLPELYRAVLVLRHYEGLKFREIADVLEVPEGTVKSRMTAALNRLAQLPDPHRKRAADPDPVSATSSFQGTL